MEPINLPFSRPYAKLDLARAHAAQDELSAAFRELFKEALPECSGHTVACQYMIRHLCEGVIHEGCGVGVLIDATEMTEDDFLALRRWADMVHKGELPKPVTGEPYKFRPVDDLLYEVEIDSAAN